MDTTVCTNLNTAKSIGIPYRDVYMFPCPTCSASAASQMQQLTSYLSANCASAFSGRVWLDIEGSQYWYSSTSTNKDWYEALVDSCKTYGVDCGVYSSSSQWSSIFGSSSYSYGSSKLLSTHLMIFNLDLLLSTEHSSFVGNPLWYAHYDNKPSFSDFSSFGGWKTPYAKQYQGDYTLCGFDVDLDYAPTWSGR